MSLFNKEEDGQVHAHLGPVVLRDLDRPQHGFPLRGPDEFLRKGGGRSLKTRVRLKEILKKEPVNRDPTFRKGTGGVRLSWDSVPRAGSIFRHLYDLGTIDFVTLRWGVASNEVAWGSFDHKRRVTWGQRPADVDVARWLPIFLEGIREYQEPYRFLAIMGGHDLIDEAKGRMHEFAADLVPPLKKALDTREPTCVTIAVELMKAIVTTDPLVAGVWVHFLRDFSQVFNLFLSKAFRVNMGYNSRVVSSTKHAIQDLLNLIQEHGGELAIHAVRRYLRVDPLVGDASFDRQQHQATMKPSHGPWKPYLLM